jgi:hypothetical protein
VNHQFVHRSDHALTNAQLHCVRNFSFLLGEEGISEDSLGRQRGRQHRHNLFNSKIQKLKIASTENNGLLEREKKNWQRECFQVRWGTNFSFVG